MVAHTALEGRNRETSVLDVAGIRGLSLVSDKCLCQVVHGFAIWRSGHYRLKHTHGDNGDKRSLFPAIKNSMGQAKLPARGELGDR